MSVNFKLIKQLIFQLENDVITKENEKFDLKEALLMCSRNWYFKDPRFEKFTDEQKNLHWRGTVAEEKSEEYTQKCDNVKCPTNIKNIPTDFIFIDKIHRYICNICGTEQRVVDKTHFSVKWTKGRLYGEISKGTYLAGEKPSMSSRNLREIQKKGEKLLRNIEKQSKKEDTGNEPKTSEFEKQKLFSESLKQTIRDVLEHNSSLFGAFIDELVTIVTNLFIQFNGWYFDLYRTRLTGSLRKGILAVLLQYYSSYRNIISPEKLNDEVLSILFSIKQPVIKQARELIRQSHTKLSLINNIYPNTGYIKKKKDIFHSTMSGEKKTELNQIYKLVKTKWNNFPDYKIKLITIAYYYTKKNDKCGIKQFGGGRKCSTKNINEHFKIDGKKIMIDKELNNYIKIIHKLIPNS